MKSYNPPKKVPCKFLYRDDYLVVINKPSGLLSVPGRGPEKQDCMLSRLRDDNPEALIIHRLDMETSGIIIFARDADIHRSMSQLFEQRLISKTYIAVVAGFVEPESGTIDLPLMSDWINRPRQKVDHEKGKPSVTRWQVISYDQENNTTRIKLHPETGRSHQLRVHLYSLGHAIVGDGLYFIQDSATLNERMLLHASEIEFQHPITHEIMQIKCSPEF